MSTHTAHSAPSTTNRTSQPGSPWRWDLIADALPGLPCGVLTLVLLDENNPFESYATILFDLMTSMVEQNHPYTYVAVGGPDATEVALDDLAYDVNAEGQGILKVFVDRAPNVADGPGPVPTLANVAAYLARSEAEGMQSLVVLDAIERARPYPAVGPASKRNTARTRKADKQRTFDLRNFARSRTSAPTVAVVHQSKDITAQAKRSMGDAADVLLLHRFGAERDWLSVTHRTPRGCWSRDH